MLFKRCFFHKYIIFGTWAQEQNSELQPFKVLLKIDVHPNYNWLICFVENDYSHLGGITLVLFKFFGGVLSPWICAD